MVKCGKVELGEPRVLDAAGAGSGGEAVSRALSSEGEAELVGSGEPRCLVELRVGVDQRTSLGVQYSMGSAGGSHKKRKAAVRTESAETQEFESQQENDMAVDGNEVKEEMSFIRGAMSDLTGWYEPKFMCDRQRRKEGLKLHDTASIMMEDDGEPLTRNLCMDNLRQEERKEPGVSGKRWRITTDEKSSRGKPRLLEANEIRKQVVAVLRNQPKKFAQSLLNEAATALQLERWPEDSPFHKRSAFASREWQSAFGKHHGRSC